MSLEFKNLTCELGGREILKNLSGEILPGKITALLGPNGCGKSTFLKAVLGLVDLKSGEIFLDQKKITGLSQSAPVLGYMPQAKEIYWPLECKAIIELGSLAAAVKSTVIAERFKVMHLLEKRIDEISGGERTLVLLARALLNQPQVIIVDEPVSELDPAYQIQVMKVLREEALRGAIVLVTMHDIHLTQRFCDEVFLMKEGQILKRGTSVQTISEDNLTEIFGIPFAANRQAFYAG